MRECCQTDEKSIQQESKFLIVSSDPDNLGVLLAIYFLMNSRGYNYTDANKYVKDFRFKIGLTQKLITF